MKTERIYIVSCMLCLILLLSACVTSEAPTTPNANDLTAEDSESAEKFDALAESKEREDAQQMDIEEPAAGLYRFRLDDDLPPQFIDLGRQLPLVYQVHISPLGDKIVVDLDGVTIYNCQTNASSETKVDYSFAGFTLDGDVIGRERMQTVSTTESISNYAAAVLHEDGREFSTEFVSQLLHELDDPGLSVYLRDIKTDWVEKKYYATFVLTSGSSNRQAAVEYDQDCKLTGYVQTDWGDYPLIDLDYRRGDNDMLYPAIITADDRKVLVAGGLEFDIVGGEYQYLDLEYIWSLKRGYYLYETNQLNQYLISTYENGTAVFAYDEHELVVDHEIPYAELTSDVWHTIDDSIDVYGTSYMWFKGCSWAPDGGFYITVDCSEYQLELPRHLQALLGSEQYTRAVVKVMDDGSIQLVMPSRDNLRFVGQDGYGYFYVYVN